VKLFKYLLEEKQAHIEFVLNQLKENCAPWLKDPQANGLLYRGTKSPIINMKVLKVRLDDRTPKDMPKDIHDELNYWFRKKFGWKVRNGVFASSNIGIAKNYHHEGDPYIFMPIGKYEYVWSPEVGDLFTDYYENDKIHTIEELEDYYGDLHNETIKYYVDGNQMYDEYMLTKWLNVEDLENIDINEPGVYKVEDIDNPEQFHKLEIVKIDFDDFVKIHFEDNYTPQEIVGMYTDRGLRYAIGSEKEICFKCNEYYFIERKFEEDIMEAFY